MQTDIVDKLNHEYNLNENKSLSETTTLYRAVRHGRAGKCPMMRGPVPKIPVDVLLDVCALHSEVSQVGEGGELRGKYFKQLLGAAVLGTKYENEFKPESAWKSCGRDTRSDYRQGKAFQWKNQDQNGRR